MVSSHLGYCHDLWDNPYVYYGCYFGLGLMLSDYFCQHHSRRGSRYHFETKKWNDNYVHLFDLMGAEQFYLEIKTSGSTIIIQT
jgi:hypothetical protein